MAVDIANDINTQPLPDINKYAAPYTQDIDLNVNPGLSKVVSDEIRIQGIRFGMELGVKWRYDEIHNVLKRHEKALDQMVDFNRVSIDTNVLLPVMVKGKNIASVDSQKSLRNVSVTYKLIEEARIVQSMPNWRDYLYREVSTPEPPDPVLYREAVNNQKDLWEKSLKTGFQEGIVLADEYFAADITKLDRDYGGRYLFIELNTLGMVTMPRKRFIERGVIYEDQNKSINIGDTISVIEDTAKFLKSDEWQPHMKLMGE